MRGYLAVATLVLVAAILAGGAIAAGFRSAVSGGSPTSTATPRLGIAVVSAGTPVSALGLAGTPTPAHDPAETTEPNSRRPTGPAAVSSPAPSSPTATAMAPSAWTASPSPSASAPGTPTPAPSTPAKLTAVATPVPSATPGTPPPTARASRIFYGYYVPYDATSWWTIEAQAGALDYIAAQWVSIDACGNIGSADDRSLVGFARSRGVKVLPTLLTSSGWLSHQILANPATANRTVEAIVTYVVEEGYDGFDLDFEGVLAEDRPALTSFVARLSAALHANRKLFAMALPPKRADVKTGWAGAFDYAALAPHLDLAIIMTYAYTTASSAPGSTAPQQWVDEVIAYTTSVIPREKVLLGVPLYGYDWNVTLGGSARALRYAQAAAIAGAQGATITADPTSRSATFTYTAIAGQPAPADPPPPRFTHDVSERVRPACANQLPTPVPGPRPTATATPLPGLPMKHVAWIEDAASVRDRLALADQHGVAGVAVWRLGQEDPAVWPLVQSWRRRSN